MNTLENIKEAIELTNQVIKEREELMPEDLTGVTKSLKKQVKELECMLATLVKVG